MARILVIGGDSSIRRTVQIAVPEGISVDHVSEATDAADRIKAGRPAAVFLLSDVNGSMGELEYLTRIPAAPPIICVVSSPVPRLIVESMRRGAFDVIAAPLRHTDVQDAVLRAFAASDSTGRFEGEVGLLAHPALSKIIGISPAVDRLRSQILRVGRNDAGVLVTGESGVGKELVARAIHAVSKRVSGPFEARNCGAIPDQLFESEVFGTEPGAFTGALRRPGALELANKGTLFLDEVGDLSLANQVKLLRVIETGEFHRVGGTAARTTSCRIISATNRDLAQEMSEGRFRKDFYYRLNVLQLVVPPLRDRTEDIPHLVRHFAGADCPPDGALFTRDALVRLADHPWPGNVRELRNVVQRSLYCAERTPIRGNEIQFG